jgi:glycosyltransferase involved in cell wall biosynthesis
VKSLDIIIPIYNEEECLQELFARLLNLRVMMKAKVVMRFIFIDDGSIDESVAMLKALCVKYEFASLITLSRNFGHQIAVTAGIDSSIGDYAAIIDADLQDPPELIEGMYDQLISGYDVVYGQRKSRAGETFFKKVSAAGFYKLLSFLCDVDIPRDAGDFRIVTKRVVSELRNMKERHRFIRGMVPWVGFKSSAFIYDRHERFAGETKYPLAKMISFAASAIFSFSKKPLVFATKAGVYVTATALFGAIYLLYLKLFTSEMVEGITVIFLAIVMMGGVQILILGIIGEYIARIFEESKGRPLYVIDEKINI